MALGRRRARPAAPGGYHPRRDPRPPGPGRPRAARDRLDPAAIARRRRPRGPHPRRDPGRARGPRARARRGRHDPVRGGVGADRRRGGVRGRAPPAPRVPPDPPRDGAGRRWTAIEDGREAVPFEVVDGLDRIAVDVDAIDEGLVVVIRESEGTAAEIPDRMPEGTPPARPSGCASSS